MYVISLISSCHYPFFSPFHLYLLLLLFVPSLLYPILKYTLYYNFEHELCTDLTLQSTHPPWQPSWILILLLKALNEDFITSFNEIYNLPSSSCKIWAIISIIAFQLDLLEKEINSRQKYWHGRIKKEEWLLKELSSLFLHVIHDAKEGKAQKVWCVPFTISFFKVLQKVLPTCIKLRDIWCCTQDGADLNPSDFPPQYSTNLECELRCFTAAFPTLTGV